MSSLTSLEEYDKNDEYDMMKIYLTIKQYKGKYIYIYIHILRRGNTNPILGCVWFNKHQARNYNKFHCVPFLYNHDAFYVFN